MLEIIALLLACMLNGILGLVVYSKNPRSASNRLFFMLTISFSVWSIVNYLSVHPIVFSQLTWIRLVLFAAAPLCLLVFLTFTVFPSHRLEGSPRFRRLALGYTVFVMALSLTPLVFSGLTGSGSDINPVPGPGIACFMLLVFGLLGGGIWKLVTKYRRSKSVQKSQLRLVLLGVAGTFGLIVVSNFLLVVGFNNTKLVPYGPAFTLVFSASFAYAIVRHRLFDIRAAAARATAYILTIATLGALYTSLVFGVSSLLLNSHQLDSTTQIVYTVMALLLAYSFQEIKRFFDRVSNSFFFKDSYDSQQFLEDLNRVLVTHVELKDLVSNTIAIMEANLKSESCTFAIQKTAYFPVRIMGTRNIAFDETDIAHLQPQLLHTRQKVIITDYLGAPHTELMTKLNQKNMAAVIRLTPRLDARAEAVGNIILGPKKSGDPYSTQDMKALEIIANELLIAIQNALRFEEIENFNLTLQQKIAEATRQLRRTNEKLKALDETKDDFISMASHQLRTPLTSVKGYLSMVLEGDAGRVNKVQKEMLGQAYFSSQRMVYLIADLLNVSRLKTGKFVIDAAPIDLSEVVGQELEQLEETAGSRSLTLQFDKPDSFPTLMLDETKTRQIIMNFVDNAIYYTPAGGHITVQLLDKPHTVELRVIDNGIGVPRSEQPHLFTKFYRAGNARKARPDGTGLGLFMAKKVVIAQGGAVIFESREGKGSTFGFTFSKSHLGVPAAIPPTVTKPPKPAVPTK